MSFGIIDHVVARIAFAGAIGYASWRLAEERHRSALGWALVGAVLGYAVELWAFAALVGLWRLPKVDLRERYLELRAHERFAQALGAPSLVGDHLEDRILMVLANNPQGLHLNALAQGVGQSWRAIDGVVRVLVERRKVVQKDDLYFIDSTAQAPAVGGGAG
ncbi:MAG: hypothetical protein U0610_10265 [bacterium]